MPPKKKVDSDAPAAEPRRSTRVASQPTKPAAEPKAKPASKKAPASKKRSAEGEPTANGEGEKETAAEKPASKKPKSTAEKPKSNAEKPKSQAEKPKSQAEKPKSTKASAADDKPKSAAASKPESKKAPASSKKPASAAKPKSGKKAADGANGDAIPEENDAAAEAEKEAEASPDAKADTGGEKELEEGDVLPSITIQDNKGQDVDVSTLCDSDNGLVIFVYPKANTPGCTTQACNYRDSYEEFEKLGYKVYGLSADTVSAQDKWATTKEFKYNLLADTKHELLKRLGAFVPPKNIKRSHFIFEKGTGKLVQKKIGVKPADDTKNALSFIQSHHK